MVLIAVAHTVLEARGALFPKNLCGNIGQVLIGKGKRRGISAGKGDKAGLIGILVQLADNVSLQGFKCV